MRNSCVQLKTKLGEIRSFLPQPPKFPGWGWGEGPTFRLSSHPTPCTCSQATPVPFSLPWGWKWGGTALLFPYGWGVGPGGCGGAACKDQRSPASAQRPCPGLMLRRANQELWIPFVACGFCTVSKSVCPGKGTLTNTECSRPHPSPFSTPSQPQEKSNSCMLEPGLLLFLYVAWFLVISAL